MRRQRAIVAVGVLGRDQVQIKVLVLQGVVELVGVRHAFGGAEGALIGEDEQGLRGGVVHPDDLVAQQLELDLDDVVGCLDQAERDQLLLIRFSLARQVVAGELIVGGVGGGGGGGRGR